MTIPSIQYNTIMCDDIWTIERNADVLLDACKNIGSAANIAEIKYMEIRRHGDMVANE
jgi:hypothetical protein